MTEDIRAVVHHLLEGSSIEEGLSLLLEMADPRFRRVWRKFVQSKSWRTLFAVNKARRQAGERIPFIPNDALLLLRDDILRNVSGASRNSRGSMQGKYKDCIVEATRLDWTPTGTQRDPTWIGAIGDVDYLKPGLAYPVSGSRYEDPIGQEPGQGRYRFTSFAVRLLFGDIFTVGSDKEPYGSDGGIHCLIEQHTSYRSYGADSPSILYIQAKGSMVMHESGKHVVGDASNTREWLNSHNVFYEYHVETEYESGRRLLDDIYSTYQKYADRFMRDWRAGRRGSIP